MTDKRKSKSKISAFERFLVRELRNAKKNLRRVRAYGEQRETEIYYYGELVSTDQILRAYRKFKKQGKL